MTDTGTVTNADLYRELLAMRQDVGKALTRIEVLDTQNTVADRMHSDFETRIRLLEAFKWKLTGIALFAATVAGVVSGVIAGNVH